MALATDILSLSWREIFQLPTEIPQLLIDPVPTFFNSIQNLLVIGILRRGYHNPAVRVNFYQNAPIHQRSGLTLEGDAFITVNKAHYSFVHDLHSAHPYAGNLDNHFHNFFA